MVVNAPSLDLISNMVHCECPSCEWLCQGDSHVAQEHNVTLAGIVVDPRVPGALLDCSVR